MNTNLIAAAPDLYAALEAIVNWGFCPSCGCNLANTEGCVWCGFISAARSALALARGEAVHA